MRIITLVIMSLFVIFLACEKREEQQQLEVGESMMKLELASAAFDEGGRIPARYTGEGADISPPLSWSGVPEETKSLALICDDPDAPGRTWVHWVIYDIQPDTTELPEAVPSDREVLGSAKQGMTDFRQIGYGGPMPPPGRPHRYMFKLYALDTMLNLESGATKEKLLNAMEGHIMAEGQLTGLYSR